jgi:hypothetical protein
VTGVDVVAPENSGMGRRSKYCADFRLPSPELEALLSKCAAAHLRALRWKGVGGTLDR